MSRRTPTRHTREVLAAITAEEIVVGLVSHEGPQPRVLRWARRARDRSVDRDDPGRLAADLAALFAEQRLGSRLHALALPDSLLTCVLTELPIGSGDTRDALVARRVRAEVGSQSATLLADHVLVDDEQTRAPEVDARAFVAWGEQDVLNDLLRGLERARIRVERLVPTSLMLLEHFAESRDASSDDLEMFGFLNGYSAVLGITAGRRLLYARFLTDTLGDAEHDSDDVALEEFERTVQFVREKQRGRRPQTLWLAGLDAERARDLGARVTADLDLAVQTVESADADVPANVSLLLLSVASGGARGAAMLDVAPARSSKRAWLFAAAAVALALATILGKVASDGAAKRAARAKATIAAIEMAVTELEAAEPQRDAERAELSRREQRHAAAREAGLVDFDPAGALLESLAQIPEGLRLVSAQFERGDAETRTRDMRLVLAGDLTGPGADSLSAFRDRLAAAPWAASVETRAGDIELTDDSGSARPLDERVSLRISMR